MKFGQKLKTELLVFDADFINSFFKYKPRKKEIKIYLQDPSQRALNEYKIILIFSFCAKIKKDIELICECFGRKLSEVKNEIEEYRITCNELKDSTLSTIRKKALKHNIQTTFGNLQLLKYFSRLNYTGIRKLLKKFDKNTKANVAPSLMEYTLSTPFVDLASIDNCGKDLQLLYSFVCSGKTPEQAGEKLNSIDPGLQRVTQPLLFHQEYSGEHLLNPDEALKIVMDKNKSRPGQVLLQQTAYEERHLRK